ncbi:hypothetical protein, partial [Sphingobium salicis]|uniref:hypothetical protein n=1 Tax=Sphingobium sp. 11R-BB TaxID=3111639 RepID=UPI003C2042C8
PTSMTPRRQQLEQPNRRRSTYQTSKAVQTNRATSELKPTGNAATRHELFVPNLYASLNTQLSYLLGR